MPNTSSKGFYSWKAFPTSRLMTRSCRTTVKQQLENDRGLEQAALTVLKPGIKTCLDASDDASRELLEHLSVDEERHIDWIELHQIEEVGLQNYLAQQIHKKS
jgi:bacterioferritin